jgi:hypothetical protein
LLSLLCACATPCAPRSYFYQDSQARYYADGAGRTLRVERDGTILDISCVPLEVADGRPRSEIPLTFCGGTSLPVVGRAARMGDDWDMSAYGVLPETGRCKPLFGAVTMDARENERRRSCWNRLWEVPTAVVAVPITIGIIIGVATAPIWGPIVLLH